MEYSIFCDKSLYLVMDKPKKSNLVRRRRISSSSPPSQTLTVNFKFSFTSVFYDSVTRKGTSFPEFLRKFDRPLPEKIISVDCRQLFHPEKAREIIADGISNWPLRSDDDRRQMIEIALDKAWAVVEPMSPRFIDGVDVNFRVIETHNHVSDGITLQKTAFLDSKLRADICSLYSS